MRRMKGFVTTLVVNTSFRVRNSVKRWVREKIYINSNHSVSSEKMGIRPVERKIETWNGKRIVVYRPNPKYSRKRAYKELMELIGKIVARETAS
jgi:hypothetical protein